MNSSNPARPGAPSRTLRCPPPHGFTGSTTTASTSTAAKYRPSNWRRPTTLNNEDQPPAESSNRKVSGHAGAVQNVVCIETRDPNVSVEVGDVSWINDGECGIGACKPGPHAKPTKVGFGLR